MNTSSVLSRSDEIAALGAEQATGCFGRSNLGAFYARGGVVLSLEDAAKALRAGQSVEVPNAGAGSYVRFFAGLGFSETKTVETNSSSGDWLLAVRDADTGRWYVAWQANRHPGYGFSYAIQQNQYFSSFEALCAHSSSY